MTMIVRFVLLSVAVGVMVAFQQFPNVYVNQHGDIIYREAYGWTLEYDPKDAYMMFENDIRINAPSKCRNKCHPPWCKGYTFAIDPQTNKTRALNNKCVLLTNFTRIVYAKMDKNAKHRFEQRSGYITEEITGPNVDQCQDMPDEEFPCRSEKGVSICTDHMRGYHCRKTCRMCRGSYAPTAKPTEIDWEDLELRGFL